METDRDMGESNMKKSLRGKLKNGFMSLLLPLIIYCVFTLVSGFRFGRLPVMLSIARQIVQTGLFAYAIYCNMAMGMWDFSAGATVLLAAIIGGRASLAAGFGIWGLILFAILTAVCINLLTMTVQHIMKLPSIIVSLGLVMLYETAGSLLFHGEGVNLLAIREQTVLGKSPYCFIVLGISMILFYTVLCHTTFGYHVRALGSGGELAKNIGVNELRTKLGTAVFGGVFLGISAAVMACLQNSAAPKTNLESVTLVFDVIMAVLIASYLARYCNITFAILIGVLSMKMLAAGLLSIGLNSTMQNVATGLFMLLFVGITSNQEKLMEHKRMRERARAVAGAGKE